MKTDTSRTSSLPGWHVILLVVLGLQLVTRFVPHAVTDFVLDDWACLAAASSASSFSTILDWSWREAARPLALLSHDGMFYFFGDQPTLFSLYSIATHSIALAIIVGIAFEVTGCRVRSLLTGITFALLPTLTESFHWGQLIGISHMLVGYLFTTYAWLRWLNRRSSAWLPAAYAAFAVSAFTYEAGLILPAAGVALVTRDNWRRLIPSLIPFGFILGIYFAWRFLGWFGDKEFLQTGNYTAGRPTLVDVLWNARQVVSWWAGARFFETLVNGFVGFGLIAKWPLRILWLADIALAILLAAWVGKHTGDAEEVEHRHSRWSDGRACLFGVAMAGAGYAICLVSWTGGRLNYLPAAGASLSIAVLVARGNLRRHSLATAVVIFACLVACQGTIEQWRRSGEFNRRLFSHIKATEPQWSRYDVMWVDTSSMRWRLTPGLEPRVQSDAKTWAHFGNAALLRGFVIKAMIEMAHPDPDRPIAAFDIECDPVIKGDQLLWHRAWQPTLKESTPLDRVIRLDPLTLRMQQATTTGLE